MRKLHQIAQEIRDDWGTKTNYAAAPYLNAMFTLTGIDDDYGYDSGTSIVLYFLSNAGGWRGTVARRVKAELNAMLKGAA